MFVARAAEQRGRVVVAGIVGVRTLQRDAHEAIRPCLEALFRDRRAASDARDASDASEGDKYNVECSGIQTDNIACARTAGDDEAQCGLGDGQFREPKL